MAAKGDTTIQMKFDVQGQAEAKQLAIDLYRTQQEEIMKTARLQRQEMAKEKAAMAAAQRQANELAASQRRADRDAAAALRQKEAQSQAVTKSLTRMGMAAIYGFAGFAGAAGIGSVIQGLAGAAGEIADKSSEFEKVITPLVSLGDNVNRISEVRMEVIGLAAAMGRSNQEAAAFLEGVNSISNAFDPEVLMQMKKESLELTELAGGDMLTNFKLLAKTNISYADSFRDVNHMQNMLLKTQEDADVPMEEMAYRFPELISSAKAFGFTFEETAAGVIAATLALGRAEGAFTGLRNVMAIMSEAESKGVKFSGSLVDRLYQLDAAAKAGKVSLLEVFGRDPTAAASGLLTMIKGVEENIKSLQNMDPLADTVADKLAIRFEDPRYSAARKHQLAQSLLENSPVLAEGKGANFLQTMMKNYQLGALKGDEYSGGMWGSQFLGGVAAMLGSNEMRVGGVERMLKYAPEGTPLHTDLIKMLEEEERDLFKKSLKTERNPDTSPSAPIAIKREFAATSPAEAPSLEKSLDIARGIDETNKLLREQNKILSGGAAKPKPGGGKNQYMEGQ